MSQGSEPRVALYAPMNHYDDYHIDQDLKLGGASLVNVPDDTMEGIHILG